MSHLPRIPFGQEQCLRDDAEQCPCCGCAIGMPHAFGCSSEECPRCHRLLIGCACDPLSASDSAKIIAALVRQFHDLDEAVSVTNITPNGEEQFSYLHHAAMQFIFAQLPPEARAEIGRAFQIRFPSLTPIAVDDAGRGYFTAEQLSEALDMPLAEVRERIEAMIEAGQGLRFADIKNLHKVH
ncbi:MAG: hypothetical protein LBU39_00750 [Desulfobulbaceae bacterium]|jgi:hypothetical protein|nr:hypothetical protein [Desulfobulbaceae bacterium]